MSNNIKDAGFAWSLNGVTYKDGYETLQEALEASLVKVRPHHRNIYLGKGKILTRQKKKVCEIWERKIYIISERKLIDAEDYVW